MRHLGLFLLGLGLAGLVVLAFDANVQEYTRTAALVSAGLILLGFVLFVIATSTNIGNFRPPMMALLLLAGLVSACGDDSYVYDCATVGWQDHRSTKEDPLSRIIKTDADLRAAMEVPRGISLGGGDRILVRVNREPFSIYEFVAKAEDAPVCLRTRTT